MNRMSIILAACMIAPVAFATEAQAQFNGPGQYTITARISGRVLDVDSSWWSGHRPGQQLLQWDSHGGANQRFLFREVPVGSGIYEIRAGQHPNLCLDVPGYGTADGTILAQWTCSIGNQHANQRFRVIPAGPAGPDGRIYYQILATHTASGFHVGNIAGTDSLNNGARLVLKRYNDTCPDQRMLFSFTPV